VIRFIIKRKVLDRHSECESERFETLDVDVPELEAVLLRGGTGMNEHDISHLVGVEIRREASNAG